MIRPPLGQQVHAVLVAQGEEAAATLARESGQPDLFERVRAVAQEEPVPNFLHSALCAMSLPVRKPDNDQLPIIRQDGQYSLMITPKTIMQPVNGVQTPLILGVPYGSLPRLVLIHIMTEAVRTRSRQLVLGSSFTDWMRRMGFKTISYGPRGSATLIRQQLDRLLACEWTIRWDNETDQGGSEFAVREIKLTNEYAGSNEKNGSFRREILMTDGFFDHLREHAVPLDENAIRQLRDSATALDLYTWLAYRLPRVNPKRPAAMTWQQLAVHFGNDGSNIRKFRQTVREAWDRQVSAVYPEARADFDTTMVRLHASPAPLQRKLFKGADLRLVTPTLLSCPTDDKGTASTDVSMRFFAAILEQVGAAANNAWFRDAKLQQMPDDEWELVVATKFKADWIRGQFERALELARLAADLPEMPRIVACTRS